MRIRPSWVAIDWRVAWAARRSCRAISGTSHPRDLRHSRSVPPSIPGIARTFASPPSGEHVLQDAPWPAPTCHYRTTARARWTGFTTLVRDGRHVMGRAAASRAEEDGGALDELEFHWGSAYDIALFDERWTARRRDGRGGTLADPLPEGLLLAIRADYAALPVPRDLP